MMMMMMMMMMMKLAVTETISRVHLAFSDTFVVIIALGDHDQQAARPSTANLVRDRFCMINVYK